jgi:SAM-dependent methyltransferase
MNKVRFAEVCRSCGQGDLMDVISLGNQFVSDFVLNEEEQIGHVRAPLDLIHCPESRGGCGLVQLRHSAPASAMWGEQYWYKSGINRMIREDLADIVAKATKMRPVNPGDLVVDIGCNDGTMLGYHRSGADLLGFEPSGNVAREAAAKGIRVVRDFFNGAALRASVGERKPAIVTAISMFYDLDYPNLFLRDVKQALHPEGLFVVQQNYLKTMLKNNAFDNICHEHLEYYSLRSLNHLLDRHGLEIFDVEQNGINGGSIRTYIKHKGANFPIQDAAAKSRLEALRLAEEEDRLHSSEPYQAFAERIRDVKTKLMGFLEEEKKKGRTICGCGASTRGNVTLQYFGMSSELMDCIFDRNPDKWGLKTIGTQIPVYSPDDVDKFKPDYQVVMIWHIFRGIGDDEKAFLERGGKFLLPLPQPKIVSAEGERYL